MAKLAPYSEVKLLVDDVARLTSGDYSCPVKKLGSPAAKALSISLEELRRELLVKDDDAGQAEKRFNEKLSDAVHDLKTPLAVLSGYVECMKDGIGERDYPTLIYEKCAELNDAVLNVIAAARAEAGKRQFRLVGAKEYFPPLFKKTASPAVAKNISVKFSHIPDVRLLINESEFGSVAANLLSNAAKFTPEGGKIRVKTYARGKKFFLKVRDNGKGIAKEDVEKIFSRYYTTDKESGSGIGLNAVKDIVIRHNGSVKCIPGKHKGVSFLVVVPSYKKDPAKTSPAMAELQKRLGMLAAIVFLPVGTIYSVFALIAAIIRAIAESAARKKPLPRNIRRRGKKSKHKS